MQITGKYCTADVYADIIEDMAFGGIVGSHPETCPESIEPSCQERVPACNAEISGFTPFWRDTQIPDKE